MIQFCHGTRAGRLGKKIVLHATLIFWQESRPLGVLDMGLCQVKAIRDHKNRFELLTPEGSMILQGLSSPDVQEWIEVIQRGRSIPLSWT